MKLKQSAIVVKKSTPVKPTKSVVQPKQKMTVKATKDSTDYFLKQYDVNKKASLKSTTLNSIPYQKSEKNIKDIRRQELKGKTGYDANGYPKKK
jgi:hypothetical protein